MLALWLAPSGTVCVGGEGCRYQAVALFSCPDVAPAARSPGSLWTPPSLLVWYIAGGFSLQLPIWLLAPGSKIIIIFPNERLWITAVNYPMIIKNTYCLPRFEKTTHACWLAPSQGFFTLNIAHVSSKSKMWFSYTFRQMHVRWVVERVQGTT